MRLRYGFNPALCLNEDYDVMICYSLDYMSLNISVNHYYPKNSDLSTKKNLAPRRKVFRAEPFSNLSSYSREEIVENNQTILDCDSPSKQ